MLQIHQVLCINFKPIFFILFFSCLFVKFLRILTLHKREILVIILYRFLTYTSPFLYYFLNIYIYIYIYIYIFYFIFFFFDDLQYIILVFSDEELPFCFDF